MRILTEDVLILKIFQDELEIEVNYVHDGDTFSVNIPNAPPILGEKILVRIYGIDAPEIRDKRKDMQVKALFAKTRLEELLALGKPILRNLRRDKYFRLLADVQVNDFNLADVLIQEGLVKPYEGKGNKPW